MKKRFILNLVLLAIFFACGQQKEQYTPRKAQPFTLTDTASVEYSLSDYQGKIVMINFWADWCPSCRKEFPKMQQVYDSLKPQEFEILAVNSGQSREHVKQIQQEYHLTFPVLVDEASAIAKLYSVAGLPTSYFVDRKGMIRNVVVGWMKEQEMVKNFYQIKEDSR